MKLPGLTEAPEAAWGDERLIEACLEGDARAWEALLHKYRRLIYAVPFRYGATADDAADIFQLVCLDLYQELPRLRKTASLRSWLMTVTARQSLKWKQARARHAGTEADLALEADPAALQWMAATERAQVVAEGLERVPERCRKLIERLFFDDPPAAYEELARELGLATGSIGFNRGRCLEKLRKALEDLGL